jgi:mannose-1-phosphate guanylyltransferase
VATLGLDNIIIVDTKDALLVCSKDKAQDIKKIVKILKQKKFKSLRCYGRIY